MYSMTMCIVFIAKVFPVTDQTGEISANQKIMIVNAVKREVEALEREMSKIVRYRKELIVGMNAALQRLVGLLSATSTNRYDQ